MPLLVLRFFFLLLVFDILSIVLCLIIVLMLNLILLVYLFNARWSRFRHQVIDLDAFPFLIRINRGLSLCHLLFTVQRACTHFRYLAKLKVLGLLELVEFSLQDFGVSSASFVLAFVRAALGRVLL